MSYMKLIKLLYLADREALLEWGRPISFDRYFSMKQGPVLSRVYELINEGPTPGVETLWHQHISDPSNYEVELRDDCRSDTLSEAERRVLARVFEEFGRMTRWEIVEWMHDNLAEWTDPGSSAIRISYRDILEAGGKTDTETSAVEDEIESIALADSILG